MEQTQPHLSKYAAKQARLASDPTFGTTYEVKTREEVEQEQKDAADPNSVPEYIYNQIEAAIKEREAKKQAAAQPVDVAKVTARIAVVTADLHVLEAKIAKERLYIERTLEVIKSKEAHAEALRAAIDKLNAKLSTNQ